MSDSDSKLAGHSPCCDHAAECPVQTRRDFMILAGAAMGGVGAAITALPLIDTMNPAADALALASIEVDLSKVEVGQSMNVTWRGKQVFIRRRTAAEIEEARAVNVKELRDPQTDQERVKSSVFGGKDMPEWLIVIGICTHFGCIPMGQKPTDNRGEYHGWFCPCHGSVYDTAGRIRKGPAPRNLDIPPYAFIADQRIKIG
ncbi:MAG: ubiquinol-cytochrome c reductase iron-sulfur subunit [Alphaproteobacteria bacterium]